MSEEMNEKTQKVKKPMSRFKKQILTWSLLIFAVMAGAYYAIKTFPRKTAPPYQDGSGAISLYSLELNKKKLEIDELNKGLNKKIQEIKRLRTDKEDFEALANTMIGRASMLETALNEERQKANPKCSARTRIIREKCPAVRSSPVVAKKKLKIDHPEHFKILEKTRKNIEESSAILESIR